MPKSESRLYVPIALKLHAYGLYHLQDSEWCGTELYDRAKRPYRGRVEPRTLFQEPLADGLLFQLGSWLFEEYFDADDELVFQGRQVEVLCEYIEDLVQVLLHAGIAASDTIVEEAGNLLARLDQLFDSSEEEFYSSARKSKWALRKTYRQLRQSFAETLDEIRPLYAQNYAERVFHDRQLCGYIAQLILDIGIDGTTEDEEPSQWCPRIEFPSWVRDSLLSRERGKCATCKVDLAAELQAPIHIDHIVPLSLGGCNDLVNLQVLCNRCNLEKSIQKRPSTTSVPPYLERGLHRRRTVNRQ
jgi:HNH endonuclease